MANFINTADIIGDDEMCDQILQRTVTEYKENRIDVVGYRAFYGCTALETVDIPNVTYIDISAFQGCTALKTVNIPEATRVNQDCFNGCNMIVDLNVPKVVRIDAKAFKSCQGLTSVNFPSAEILDPSCFAGCIELMKADFGPVNSINGTAFYNCNALTAVILRRTDGVATLYQTSAFTNTPIASGTGYIYVPSVLVDDYKAAENWSTYADQFRAIEDYPDI